jgi:hypothetical protein
MGKPNQKERSQRSHGKKQGGEYISREYIIIIIFTEYIIVTGEPCIGSLACSRTRARLVGRLRDTHHRLHCLIL